VASTFPSDSPSPSATVEPFDPLRHDRQLPSLRRDIVIPEFCKVLAPEDEMAPRWCETRNETPLMAAWLGPAGTVSPLHHDPHHNILVQVVGYKYVRIYGSDQTHRLYPMDGDRCNSSQVDVDEFEQAGSNGLKQGAEGSYRDRFPRFGEAPFWQCVLGPGDGLYIPRHAYALPRSARGPACPRWLS